MARNILDRKTIFSPKRLHINTFVGNRFMEKTFVEKYELKNEATSNIKIKEILKLMNITECGIYMRKDKFTTPSGIVSLHPTKGTHWVMFVNEFYFDSDGCPPPLNIMSFINNGFNSENQIQKNDCYCAAYCLYVLYLTTNIIGFKNAVLN